MYANCLPDYNDIDIQDSIILYVCKINELLGQILLTVQYNVYLCERLQVINIQDDITLNVYTIHIAFLWAHIKVEREAQGSLYRGAATYDGKAVEAETTCCDFKQ